MQATHKRKESLRTISTTVCVVCVVIGGLAERVSKLSLSEAIAGRFAGVQTSSTPEAPGGRPLRRLHGVRKRWIPLARRKIAGNRNFIRNPIGDITSREAALLELRPPRSTGGCDRPTKASPEAPESGKAPFHHRVASATRSRADPQYQRSVAAPL